MRADGIIHRGRALELTVTANEDMLCEVYATCRECVFVTPSMKCLTVDAAFALHTRPAGQRVRNGAICFGAISSLCKKDES